MPRADPATFVAVIVLARAARAALDRDENGADNGDSTAYDNDLCCCVNPLHGPAISRHHVLVAAGGNRRRLLPVCGFCRDTAVAEPRELHTLFLTLPAPGIGVAAGRRGPGARTVRRRAGGTAVRPPRRDLPARGQGEGVGPCPLTPRPPEPNRVLTALMVPALARCSRPPPRGRRTATARAPGSPSPTPCARRRCTSTRRTAAVPPARQQQLAADRIRRTGLPIKVVRTPLTKGDAFDGDSDVLPAAVHDRLARRHLILITTDGDFADWLHGYEWPADTHQTRDAVAAVGFLPEMRDAGLADRAAKAVELVAGGTRVYEEAARDPGGLSSPGRSVKSSSDAAGWGLWLLTAVPAPALATLVARTRIRRRSRPALSAAPHLVFAAARTADEAELRRRAEDEVLSLGEAVQTADVAGTPGLRRALDAYARAGTVLDKARGLPDLAGVLPLLAEGRDALTDSPGLPLCFFNPLHGRAARHTRWRPLGRRDRPDVAVCQECADALRTRRAPEVLTDTTDDGRAVPYFELPGERSVWAATGYGSLKSRWPGSTPGPEGPVDSRGRWSDGALMTPSTAPRTDTELVERVRALRPLIRDHALRTEQARRVTPEVVDSLTEAGIFRMNVPRRYGGHQSGLRTQVDALAEVSAACGSAGFMALIQAGCAYIAALFPDEAQDEMFTSPDVRISGTLVPGPTAVPTGDGGYVVNGTSAFATGCRDADWHLLTARVESGDGPPEVLWTAIPMAELEVLDDWDVSGLAGSGSNSVVARDVVVPAHRVLPVGPLLAGSFPSKTNAEDPFYRRPVLLMFCAWATPNALGLARSALAEFQERMHRRGITYTFYERQSEATVTHLQAAEAALKITCAELLTGDIVTRIESPAASGEPYPAEVRARIRAQTGHVARLCTEAADLIGSACGASSLHRAVPIQRTVRDLHALSLHSLVNPATNLELYGRILSGLDAGTPYL